MPTSSRTCFCDEDAFEFRLRAGMEDSSSWYAISTAGWWESSWISTISGPGQKLSLCVLTPVQSSSAFWLIYRPLVLRGWVASGIEIASASPSHFGETRKGRASCCSSTLISLLKGHWFLNEIPATPLCSFGSLFLSKSLSSRKKRGVSAFSAVKNDFSVSTEFFFKFLFLTTLQNKMQATTIIITTTTGTTTAMIIVFF